MQEDGRMAGGGVMKWFRWHRGLCANPDFAVIAVEADKGTSPPGTLAGGGGEGNRCYGAVTVTDVIAVWAVMLEYAASDDDWGTCKKDAIFIATVLRWWPDEVQSVLNSFEKHDMIERVEGDYRIVNWNKYQYLSDSDPTSTERQRRYRDRHKTDVSSVSDALPTRSGTDSNGSVTALVVDKKKAHPEPLENKQISNALLERPDTKTDREKESSLSGAKESPPVKPAPPEKEAADAKPKRKPATRGTRLPKDWKYTETNAQFATSRGYTYPQIQSLAEGFCAYHQAKGDTSKNWDASWRVWVLRDLDFHGPPGTRGKKHAGPDGSGDSFAAIAIKVAARMAADGSEVGNPTGVHGGGNGSGQGDGQGLVIEHDDAAVAEEDGQGTDQAERGDQNQKGG